MRNASTARRNLAVLLTLVAALCACSRDKQGGILLHVDVEPATLRDAIVSLRVTVDGQAQIYQPTSLPGSLGIRTSPGNKHIIVEGPATAPVARWEGPTAVEADKVTEYTVLLRPVSSNGQDGGVAGEDGAVDRGGSVGGADAGDASSSGRDGAVDGGSVGGADTGGATQRDAGGDVRTIDGGAGKAVVVHGQLGSRGSGSASAGIYRVSRDGFVFGPRVCAGNVCQSGGIAR